MAHPDALNDTPGTARTRSTSGPKPHHPRGLTPSLAAFAGGGLLSMFPLWSSADLPQDSVQRRIYWTAVVAGSFLLFLAQLPDLSGGLFVAVMTTLVMFTAAGFWTDHIKIGGRIYSASNFGGRSDRPPARRGDD